MRQDDRGRFDRALARARRAAYPPGEFVGQESFMRASEIRALAVRAGVGAGVPVLDLCCGVGGPGRFLTAELGCDYLGVDASPAAIHLARERGDGLACRFEVAHVPPVPHGRFDVVLLLETFLAFPDKGTLLGGVAATLPVGGRFAFTVEEGAPLTRAERDCMPDADTVWPVPLGELRALLDREGLRVTWHRDETSPHLVVAEAMLAALSTHRSAIAADLGPRAVQDLLAAHLLWCHWLQQRRVRKLAFVAEKGELSLVQAGSGPLGLHN